MQAGALRSAGSKIQQGDQFVVIRLWTDSP
jgi:hypothetical protein